MKRLLLALCVIIWAASAAQAQTSLAAFAWEAGSLSLWYPANWQPAEAAAESADGSLYTLTIAASGANDPNRPPDVPFVRWTRAAVPPAQPLEAVLAEALRAAGLTSRTTTPDVWLGSPAAAAFGTSDTLEGRARATLLPDGSLLMVLMRWPQAPDSTFSRLFDQMTNSVLLDTSGIPLALQYAVLWSWFAAAGDTLYSLPDVQRLAVVDDEVLALDSSGQGLALSRSRGVVARPDASAALAAADLPQGLVLPAGTSLIDAVSLPGDIIAAATDAGVLVFSPAGDILSSVGMPTADTPLAGEVWQARAVAADDEGVLYTADGDGTYLRVTAWLAAADPRRSAPDLLAHNRLAHGHLDSSHPTDIWWLRGQRGDTLTAFLSAEPGSDLDVRVRLIGPDSREVGVNDTAEFIAMPLPTDAALLVEQLPADGVYAVVAERVSGSGRYRLALDYPVQVLAPPRPGEASASIILGDAQPVVTLRLNAAFDHVVTLTAEAVVGSPDPLLRLLDARGQVLAENDDADDPALGLNARLVDFNMPATGTYLLQVVRQSGEGEVRVSVQVR